MPDHPHHDYQVSWTNDDAESTSPEAAAHEALRALHDAFAGDSGALNVFTVVDRRLDQVHRIDLGDPDGPENSVTTVWPRPEGTRFETRLNPVDARHLVGEDGFAALRVRIDQELYLSGYAMFLSGSGGDDHWGYLHHEAFSFGTPYDCTAEIVAVDGSDFLVDYRLDLAAVLAEHQRTEETGRP